MPGKKSGKFDNEGIEGLAKDKPVVYQIEDDKRNLLYVGVAKRGRVEARLKEHMTDGVDPVRGGAKVRIQQKSSIMEAQKPKQESSKEVNHPKTNRVSDPIVNRLGVAESGFSSSLASARSDRLPGTDQIRTEIHAEGSA